MNTLLTMESANIFCGAGPADSQASNHLTLSEVKLPGFDEQYVDHRAGGAPVAIEIDTIFAKLDCTFSLAGWSPQVISLLNSWSAQQNTFSIYGAIRDRMSGEVQQAVAHIKGRLGRADPQNWRKGDLQHWQYAIRGIVAYQLSLAGGLMVSWDFFQNRLIIGTADTTLESNRSINVPLNATASGVIVEGGIVGGGTIG